MKKILSVILVLACLLSLLVPVNAATLENRKIEYFEDGSYLVTTTAVNNTARSNSVSGQRSTHYYNADNTLQWTFTLYGTFSNVTGEFYECIAASCDVQIYNSEWQCASKSAYTSGNMAIGHVTMNRNVLGITVDTKSASLSITCDNNGNLT